MGAVVRVGREASDARIFQVSRCHVRWTAAVQSLMFTLKSIHTDMLKLICFSSDHEKTHLEQKRYNNILYRMDQQRTQPSNEG